VTTSRRHPRERLACALAGGQPEPPVVVVVERLVPTRVARVDQRLRGAHAVVLGREQEHGDGDARHGRDAPHPVLHVVEPPVAPRLANKRDARRRQKKKARLGSEACRVVWRVVYRADVADVDEEGAGDGVHGHELAGGGVQHLEAADALVLLEHGEEARVRVGLHAGGAHRLLRVVVPVDAELARPVLERVLLQAQPQAGGQLAGDADDHVVHLLRVGFDGLPARGIALLVPICSSGGKGSKGLGKGALFLRGRGQPDLGRRVEARAEGVDVGGRGGVEEPEGLVERVGGAGRDVAAAGDDVGVAALGVVGEVEERAHGGLHVGQEPRGRAVAGHPEAAQALARGAQPRRLVGRRAGEAQVDHRDLRHRRCPAPAGFACVGVGGGRRTGLAFAWWRVRGRI
jgi:hypothetical protein